MFSSFEAPVAECISPSHTFPFLQAEVDAATWEEVTAIAEGHYDPRAVDAIVRDLMAEDDADEAELPRLARRNPVVAAAAVSGRN